MRTRTHHNAKNTRERGMTVMEGLVVIGIMTIILVMITQIFSVSYDIFVKQTARAQNDTGAVLATRTISERGRGATRVLTSATINGTLYTTSDEVLVLESPGINATYAILGGVFDTIAVYRHATNTDEIWTDTEAGAGSIRPAGQKRITENNTGLVFRYNDADPTNANRISIFLTNSQIVRAQTFTTNAWTSIFIRNK